MYVHEMYVHAALASRAGLRPDQVAALDAGAVPAGRGAQLALAQAAAGLAEPRAGPPDHRRRRPGPARPHRPCRVRAAT
ncbi:hypothetical protein SGPA1_41247 [Streptomyces misionensis JCM 4497]